MSSSTQSEREELVRRDIEVWNSGETNAIEEIYADDAVVVDPMGERHDVDSYIEYIRMIRTAFPDFHVEIEAVIEEDEAVGIRYTFNGTMEGPFRGFEPTGESFELHGIAWYHIEGGQITESWNATNTMAMAQQLGLLG